MGLDYLERTSRVLDSTGGWNPILRSNSQRTFRCTSEYTKQLSLTDYLSLFAKYKLASSMNLLKLSGLKNINNDADEINNLFILLLMKRDLIFFFRAGIILLIENLGIMPFTLG